ncbi:MAG: hypothetical protein ACK5RM_17535, partial [Pseudanabaena sp.]
FLSSFFLHFIFTSCWVFGGGATPPTTSASILRNSFGLRKSYIFIPEKHIVKLLLWIISVTSLLIPFHSK